MIHVDNFIDSAGMPANNKETDAERYAKFFFLLKRLPAVMQNAFKEQIEKYELYCDYEGKTWRVTGASRMGDIWLTSDMTQTTGYEERVDLALCSNWQPAPIDGYKPIPLYTHPHPDNLGLAQSIIKQQQAEIEALKAENKSLIAELEEWEDEYEPANPSQ